MKNQYKRQDIFRCVHQAHSAFENVVSVYHVMKQKKCYPNGCIYFLYRCKKLNKGLRCPRNYTHVGRNCFGCQYFYDIKVINHPKIIVDNEKYNEFIKELKDWEDWLSYHLYKEIDFSGEIKTVKPFFKKEIAGKNSKLRFKGFLLTFINGFFNITRFEDPVYAVIPPFIQQRFNFVPGDKIEFLARLFIDKGRLVLKRLRRIEIDEKGDGFLWTTDAVRVVKVTGKMHTTQDEKCLICPMGCLIDVEEIGKDGKIKLYRRLFCLEGHEDPYTCGVPALLVLEKEQCAKDLALSL